MLEWGTLCQEQLVLVYINQSWPSNVQSPMRKYSVTGPEISHADPSKVQGSI